MNKIRFRLMIAGNYTDYEIETKAKSESGFKDAIKREMEQWGIKPVMYRYDLIIDGREVKSKYSYPILDKRFL